MKRGNEFSRSTGRLGWYKRLTRGRIDCGCNGAVQVRQPRRCLGPLTDQLTDRIRLESRSDSTMALDSRSACNILRLDYIQVSEIERGLQPKSVEPILDNPAPPLFHTIQRLA